nr:hypothetical protein [Deltaproteobacteria bacterium]
AALVILAMPAAASAAPPATMTIEGEVMQTTSRWTRDGSRIVTEATVHTDAGEIVVSQLGGSVDGIGMRTMPGPEMLVPGMRVAVAAHPDEDLARRTHVVVDRVRVLAMPPGYVRTGPTKAGNSLYWESGCIFVTADAAGTKQLPGDTEFGVIERSIATWNAASATCSYMELKYQGVEAREVGRDRVNIIKFRDMSWCRPAVDDDPARCYADSAAGITTAVYVDDAGSDRDGAIVDADIEINGKFFAISDNGVTLGTESCKAELSNTLTHELGHLHGIEHPCLADGDPMRVDHMGRAVPLCRTVMDPKIVEATMFNFQECGETKKASLEAEDIAAVCGIYPRSEDPGTCEPVSLNERGCCSAADRPVPAVLLAGLTLLLVGRRRRRTPS